MAPQRDMIKIAAKLAEITLAHTPELTDVQQDQVLRKLVLVTQKYQGHIHMDHITDGFTKALKPLDLDIKNKALLLNKALEAVRQFLNIKPRWHTPGQGTD